MLRKGVHIVAYNIEKVFIKMLRNRFECVENQHWSIWLEVLSGYLVVKGTGGYTARC